MVEFNGTGTVAIRDSHNVSSVADNGTGNYQLYFANNMANSNYSVSGAFTRVGATDNILNVYDTGFSTSEFNFELFVSSTMADTTGIYLQVFGD